MAAYGRHRGVTASAVLRAVRKGRLVKSIVRDAKGRAKIADVALADQEWEANTDLSRAPGYVKERTVPGKVSALSEASAREKAAKAQLAELEYARKSGDLVSAKQVQAALVDTFTRCRSKLLSLPSKAKSALPHLTKADLAALDRIVRQALEELAVKPSGTMSNGSAA